MPQAFFLQGFYNFSGKEVDADFWKAYTKDVPKKQAKKRQKTGGEPYGRQ